MHILDSMLNRAGIVADTPRTRKDHTRGREVTVVAAHAGGWWNRTLYFTVMWQPSPESRKYFFTYPAGWVYLHPQPATKP
jgi:hypothetical protein